MMKDQEDTGMALPAALLRRIADALERLAPARKQTDWHAFPAYVWAENGARGIAAVDAPALELMRGIDQQKQAIVSNVCRLADGYPAHDMLLWGARGTGKSAVLRAAVVEAQQEAPNKLALVQVGADAVNRIANLFAELAQQDRQFLVFIDDLGFAAGDDTGPRHLRSWLEGGVDARPANVRLAVTSNRRAIVARHMSEQDDPINPRDAVDDQLALADRFGLSLGFHALSQDDYLAIIGGYADYHDLSWDAAEALGWSKRRGARSGRVAWQFITELAGRAGRNI